MLDIPQLTIFNLLTKRTLYIILLLFLPNYLLAQEKFHHHFTVDAGLPSNVVYKVIQDKAGFIYVCTEKGVAMFDGYVFKPIENIEQKLNSKDVWELIVDEHNRKWFFTMNAEPVIISKGKSYTLGELAPLDNGKLEPWYLTSFYLKYATDSKLLLLNKNDSSTYYLNETDSLIEIPLPKQTVGTFINSEKLNLVFHTDYLTITYFKGKTEQYNYQGKLLRSISTPKLSDFTTIHQEEYFAPQEKTILYNDKGRVFTYTKDSIKRIKGKIKAPSYQSIIGGSRTHTFYKIKDVIYAMDKSTNETRFFTKKIKGARQIFEDKERNLWISSQEDGMYLLPYHGRVSRIYDETNGLAYPKITAMAFDQSGQLYLGNNYGQSIFVFDGTSFKTMPKENKKDYFIHTDSKNNIWLSGANLISKNKITLNSNTTPKIRLSTRKANNRVLNNISMHPKSISQSDNYLFFGRNKLFRAKHRNNNIQIDSIWACEDVIYALEAISDTEIYIGTTNGVYFMNSKKKDVKKVNDKKLSGNIRDMRFINNELWVANDKYGLVVYHHTKKTSKVTNKIRGSTVSNIHYDPTSSSKYISTNNGLFKIESKGQDYTISKFTTTHGLPTNEVNCCLTRNNKLYIGTARGLAILPMKKNSSRFQPKFFLTRFNVNGKDYSISSTYNLNHDENHLIIELTALSFSSLGNIDYHYRLQGADDKWTISKTRKLEYPNLPPGNYTLFAKAFDANGREASNQLKIKINIEPPISQRWWFQLLAILLLIGLIALFFYWRSQEKNKKIELEKQFSNLKLEALQSQLNSHFIFNALNAIQAYIIQKDERAASKYMSQFAKLMRAFLDSSRNRTISIADEIEFIKTYVSLESIIYEGKFESDIVVSPNLDTSQKIPSNITQPFIENAILHGLMPLKRKGNLKISFIKKDDLVAQCIIQDDGVGYKSSQKTKTIKSKSHGQNIIHERIDILKKDHQLEVDIEIIDRKKAHNDDGTIIVINFKDNGAD